MRISDWSSDVCSSDLQQEAAAQLAAQQQAEQKAAAEREAAQQAAAEREAAQRAAQQRAAQQSEPAEPKVVSASDLRPISTPAPRYPIEADRKSTRLNSSH